MDQTAEQRIERSEVYILETSVIKFTSSKGSLSRMMLICLNTSTPPPHCRCSDFIFLAVTGLVGVCD